MPRAKPNCEVLIVEPHDHRRPKNGRGTVCVVVPPYGCVARPSEFGFVYLVYVQTESVSGMYGVWYFVQQSSSIKQRNNKTKNVLHMQILYCCRHKKKKLLLCPISCSRHIPHTRSVNRTALCRGPLSLCTQDR